MLHSARQVAPVVITEGKRYGSSMNEFGKLEHSAILGNFYIVYFVASELSRKVRRNGTVVAVEPARDQNQAPEKVEGVDTALGRTHHGCEDSCGNRGGVRDVR